MILLTLMLVCLFGIRNVCWAQADPDPIVNGKDAPKGKYPWQVLLKYNSSFACSGSLIRTNVVLTAAHCVFNDPGQVNATFSAVLGEHDLLTNEETEVEIRAASTVMHPDYKDDALPNDIALVFLENDVTLTNWIQLVPQLSNKTLNKAARKSKDAWASGWGLADNTNFLYPAILQEVKTNIISNTVCDKKLRKYNISVSSDMVCTLNKKNKGVCFGDSGGPVGFFKDGTYVQVGIVSWGPRTSPYCYSGRQVHARVSRFIGWIENMLSSVSASDHRPV